LAAGLALLPWWLMARGLPAAQAFPDRRAQCEQEFARLGITPPEEWTETGVQMLLDRLDKAHAEAILETDRKNERHSLRIDLENLEGRFQALRATAERVKRELGIPVAWDDLWLHPIVNAIARWQEDRKST